MTAAARNLRVTRMLSQVRPIPTCHICKVALRGEGRYLPSGELGCVACYRAINLNGTPGPAPCVNCGVETNERDAEGLHCHQTPCAPVLDGECK